MKLYSHEILFDLLYLKHMRNNSELQKTKLSIFPIDLYSFLPKLLNNTYSLKYLLFVCKNKSKISAGSSHLLSSLTGSYLKVNKQN